MSVFSQLSAVRLGGLRWEQQTNRIPFRDTGFQGPTLGSGTDRSSNPSARKRIRVLSRVESTAGSWRSQSVCGRSLNGGGNL